MSVVGVQPMAERVRLLAKMGEAHFSGVNRTAVELTLGESLRVRDHLSAAIDLVRDDRSVLPDLRTLIASLPLRRRA